MKKRFYIIIFLTIIIVSACVKDKTNHVFNELNEVTIEGMEDVYEGILGETLEIDPVIKTKFDDDSKLEYLWYVYNKVVYTADTLSRAKKLEMLVNGVTPGIDYWITLKVTNSETKVFAQKTVKFIPVSAYSKGTLLLCEEDGSAELNFLRIPQDRMYENLYASVNNGDLLNPNSSRVFSIDPNDRNPIAHKAVIISSNSANGGVYLNPVTFERTAYINEKFVVANQEPLLDIQHYCVSQTADYLIINGQFHNRENTYSGAEVSWLPKIIVRQEPSDYYLAPFSLHPGPGTPYAKPVLYDNLNNRFAHYDRGGALKFYNIDNPESAPFNPDNMGEGMQMVCAGYFDEASAMWALIKNINNNKFFIIRFDILVPPGGNWWDPAKFIPKAKIEITPDMAPNLIDAQEFESMSDIHVTSSYPWIIKPIGLSGRLIYLVNNKVYALNTNVGAGEFAEGMIIDGSAENLTIDRVKSHPIFEPTDDNPDNVYTRIDLCVKDLSLSGKQGGVVFYRTKVLGGLSVEEIYRKTGFCDKVIDIDEKFK